LRIAQMNNRALIIRAKLAQVFALVSPLKLAALEHYQNTLKFPSQFEELGYKRQEFEDGKLIDRIEFTAEGGILLQLGKDFDPNSKLLLLSDALKNHQIFKWQCKTNIPQHYLGPISAAACEFSEGF
ncbi:MAG: pilin, partial [Marinagarivorans sp.]|nr:pilin [Marinagarivorans sp.]